MNNDDILSPPVGKYRHNGSTTPVYALRNHTLDHPMLPHNRQRQLQALIYVLDYQLQWINVSNHEVTLN